jgi:hypothetical protein
MTVTVSFNLYVKFGLFGPCFGYASLGHANRPNR